MKHALTGEEADAMVTWFLCGTCECWLTEEESRDEDCPGPDGWEGE